MIFKIDESAAPQTTNIDGRAIWKRCTHSDIACGLFEIWSIFQTGVWTKYLQVYIILGAHVLKIALRKLSPGSFRQDFFSHKLVIALDCTQKKKRFNFLFLFISSPTAIQLLQYSVQLSKPGHVHL